MKVEEGVIWGGQHPELWIPTENKETEIEGTTIRFKATLSLQIWCDNDDCPTAGNGIYDDRCDTFEELLQTLRDAIREHRHDERSRP